MPRRRKTSENEEAQPNGAGAPAADGSVAQPAPKKKRTSRRKTASAPVANKIAVDAAPPEISDDAIRLRAYFIAEERLRLAIPGDAASDWLEARRQLVAERGES